MLKKPSINLIKLPMAIFAIGFLLFCLPNLLHADQREKTIDYKSASGKTYRIFIRQPEYPMPEKGWPLIMLLDGNTTFAIASAEKPQALIVAIGYPTRDKKEIVQKRFFDLTTKAEAENIPLRQGMKTPKTGGEATYRTVIINDILPIIFEKYKVNPNDMTLYGHSLGGLFVMNSFFSDDMMAFSNYCAADPSIWWNKHQYMKNLKKVSSYKATPHLQITTSGKRIKTHNNDKKAIQKIKKLRSGPNGADVSKILAQKGFPNDYIAHPNETHGSLIKPSIHDCLIFSGLIHPEHSTTK